MYLAELEKEANSLQVQITRFSRKLFGEFVPQLNYLSPWEIEHKLIEEIREAILTVAQVDRELLSKSFVDILSTLSSSEPNKPLENYEIILQEIQYLSKEIQTYPLQDSMLASDVNSKLHEMLNSNRFEGRELNHFFSMIMIVYRDSLKKIVDVQKQSFALIDKYLASVNEFLEGKKLKVCAQDEASHQPSIKLIFDDESSSSIHALSSGERQIITLLYAATHMSQQNLVLIDEPEISLHVDWQRLLLEKMSDQLGNRQIIACTHSPVIPADYEDNFVELNAMPTDRTSWYPAPEPDEYTDQDTSTDEDADRDADKLGYSEDEFN